MISVAPFSVRTASGRVLSGRITGAEDARPVLFVAGAATGQSMVFGEELLEAAGVRIVTMDRPGMGASTHDPERTLASTVTDYGAFMSAATGRSGLFPIIANSQGVIFGAAAAQAGLATQLILVSPADELAHPAVRAQLPPEATVLADLAASDPAAATDVLRGFSADAMEAMVLAGSGEADRSFYATEEFRVRYRAALAEGFANGGAGYVVDTLLAMRPWETDLAQIDVPVEVLFGAEDLSHSPDHGATLASRFRAAHRTVLPDAGGALLWTHAAEVLRRLR